MKYKWTKWNGEHLGTGAEQEKLEAGCTHGATAHKN